MYVICISGYTILVTINFRIKNIHLNVTLLKFIIVSPDFCYRIIERGITFIVYIDTKNSRYLKIDIKINLV